MKRRFRTFVSLKTLFCALVLCAASVPSLIMAAPAEAAASTGGDVVRVFILPPSMEELRARLERRATDSQEIIDARMARADNEVSHWDGYDYVLVNDDVEQCFAHVKTILAAERLRRSRQTGIIGFIRKLKN